MSVAGSAANSNHAITPQRRAASPGKRQPGSPRKDQLSMEQLLDKLQNLEKYKADEEKGRKKEDTQKKKEIAAVKKSLTREIQAHRGNVRKRNMEVGKLRQQLAKIEAKQFDSAQKKTQTASKLDEVLHKADKEHSSLEVELQAKLGEVGEAKGTLAYLEYAQAVLDKGIVLGNDPGLKALAQGPAPAALTQGGEEAEGLNGELLAIRAQYEEAEEQRLALQNENGAARAELEEENDLLREENRQLREENEALRAQLARERETVQIQDERIENLRSKLHMATVEMRHKVSRIEELTESVVGDNPEMQTAMEELAKQVSATALVVSTPGEESTPERAIGFEIPPGYSQGSIQVSVQDVNSSPERSLGFTLEPGYERRPFQEQELPMVSRRIIQEAPDEVYEVPEVLSPSPPVPRLTVDQVPRLQFPLAQPLPTTTIAGVNGMMSAEVHATFPQGGQSLFGAAAGPKGGASAVPADQALSSAAAANGGVAAFPTFPLGQLFSGPTMTGGMAPSVMGASALPAASAPALTTIQDCHLDPRVEAMRIATKQVPTASRPVTPRIHMGGGGSVTAAVGSSATAMTTVANSTAVVRLETPVAIGHSSNSAGTPGQVVTMAPAMVRPLSTPRVRPPAISGSLTVASDAHHRTHSPMSHGFASPLRPASPSPLRPASPSPLRPAFTTASSASAPPVHRRPMTPHAVMSVPQALPTPPYAMSSSASASAPDGAASAPQLRPATPVQPVTQLLPQSVPTPPAAPQAPQASGLPTEGSAREQGSATATLFTSSSSNAGVEYTTVRRPGFANSTVSVTAPPPITAGPFGAGSITMPPLIFTPGTRSNSVTVPVAHRPLSAGRVTPIASRHSILPARPERHVSPAPAARSSSGPVTSPAHERVGPPHATVGAPAGKTASGDTSSIASEATETNRPSTHSATIKTSDGVLPMDRRDGALPLEPGPADRHDDGLSHRGFADAVHKVTAKALREYRQNHRASLDLRGSLDLASRDAT